MPCAYIRLRTDTGKYITASPNWFVNADNLQPPDSGNILEAITEIASDNGTVFQVYTSGSALMFKAQNGNLLSGAIGTFGDMHYHAAYVIPCQNCEVAYWVNAQVLKDVSMASMTIPMLNVGVLAPFAHNDVIQIYPDFTNGFQAWGWRSYGYDMYNHNGAPTNMSNFTTTESKSMNAGQFFTVSFVGDPQDGIIQFSNMKGYTVYSKNTSSACPQCSVQGSMMLFADNSGQSVDFQLGYDVNHHSSEAANGVYPWKMNVVAINGNTLKTSIPVCSSQFNWPSHGTVIDFSVVVVDNSCTFDNYFNFQVIQPAEVQQAMTYWN